MASLYYGSSSAAETCPRCQSLAARGIAQDSGKVKLVCGNGHEWESQPEKPPEVIGRALTYVQKHVITHRLLAAWEKVPELRLGQLIENVLHAEARRKPIPLGQSYAPVTSHMLYLIEDEAFVTLVDEWVDAHLKKERHGNPDDPG